MMEPFSVESFGSWRMRDAADELLESVKDITNTRSSMSVSSSFDFDMCLARLRRDKAAVVRSSFGVAAQTVLQAIQKEDGDTSLQETDEASLPPLVEQWQQLLDMRAHSMKRALDNQVVRKLKSSDVTSPGSTGTTKGQKNAVDSKKSDSPKSTASTVATITNPAAATMESRNAISRAVLCTAASIAFNELTPAHEGHDIDVVDVPQNTLKAGEETQPPAVNMGAVLLQAQALGKRAASLAENAARRSRQRYEYRRDNAQYQQSPRSVMQMSNPFAPKTEEMDVDDDEDSEEEIMSFTVSASRGGSVTEEWKSICLPRFMTVLEKGSGHAVYCDVEWPTRHGRIAHLLEQLADKTRGPHLIVTTKPEVDAFALEFRSVDDHMNLMPNSAPTDDLRVLTYTGSKSHRRKLRQKFASANGLRDSSFHVMVTSYSVLLIDYLHLCQMPYQVVILDDGWSWLAAADIDSNSSLGTLWEQSIFSASDQHIGLAGTMQKKWDFSDDTFSEERVKNACIGLTARNRILTTPSLSVRYRDSRHQGPVPGLVGFLLPQFADVVREEWDRSRIVTDTPSMAHMRKLTSRSIVVHRPTKNRYDLYQLAMDGMNSALPPGQRSYDPEVPEVIEDETFIADGKVSQSRRSALACFGPVNTSWMRYELGKASFQEILAATGVHGHLCEEVATASSMTSSGASGTVSGTMAYRLAVRCGRTFGSEQGLRQHMAAMHAPPGTWLCRTCGSDCGTSPARTHHERTCGQPPGGVPMGGGEQGSIPVGGASAVGQGIGSGVKQNGPVGKVGKKAKKPVSAADAVDPEGKDSDGSLRVPDYRGVWVNPAGKHFVKINGKRLRKGGDKKDDEGDVLFFDTIDLAAKKHDEVAHERGVAIAEGLNFNKDGSRIVYEDSTPAAAAGRGLEMLGGGASSVVPALSVINIKDLPKDVKPLLRDPRQTSRTGGNSKRHIYAYRGVCRQARKGHDRWQSQISFGGTNHYLGTFDSEWDAAAIYAWAHLILYGEEATKKAQKEGEEAAAAYEQEKRDIAAGKVVVPPPKPVKKKKKKGEKKSDDTKEGDESTVTPVKRQGQESKTPESSAKKPKKKRARKDEGESDKRAKVSPKSGAKSDISSILPVLTKGVVKVPILAPRKVFEFTSDTAMTHLVMTRIHAARQLQSCASVANLRPCAPAVPLSLKPPSGGAVLMGLSSWLFGWDVDGFLDGQGFDHDHRKELVSRALQKEYDADGYNESFRTVLQGTVCVMGCASRRTERAWKSLGLGPLPLGGTVGELDCHIGGFAGSCSESAATIAFCPSGGSDFQFCANNENDVVTLNGCQINFSMGSFPLFNEDICTVGSRVFVFLLPNKT